MRYRKNLTAIGLALLLIACAIGYFGTTDEQAPARTAGKQLPSLIDERLLKTARRLAALADTNDEQDQAREALRLSDHELDVAFVTALREAATPDPKEAAGTAEQ